MGWASLLPDPPEFQELNTGELFNYFDEGLAKKSDVMDLRAGLGLRDQNQTNLRKWAKLACVCTLMIIGPFFLNHYAKMRAWRAESMQSRAEIARLYEQATGDIPSGDIAALVKARLTASTSGVSFVELSSVLFDAVKEVEDVEVESVTYDAKKSVLNVSLLYPNFETGAVMEKEIAARGGQLNAPGIREKNGRLVSQGELSLSEGKAR